MVKNFDIYYRRLFETAKDGIVLIDFKNGAILDVNQFLIDLLGYSKKDLIEKYFWEIDALKNIVNSKKNFSSLQKREYIHLDNSQLKTKTGKKINVEFIANAYPVGNKKIIQCNIRDISTRKQTEEKLKYSISLLNASLESTADGILIVDINGKISKWNKKFVDMWKIPEEILSTSDDQKTIKYVLSQITNPNNFLAKIKKLYEHPRTTSFDQIEFLDGRVFERYSQSQKIGKDIVGRVWSFRDITNKKRAELEISKFSKAVDNACDTIIFTDIKGNIIYVNKSLKKTFDYSQKEILSLHISKLCADPEKSKKIFLDVIKNDLWEGETISLKKNGKIFYSRLSSSTIKDQENNIIGTMDIITDITHEKEIDKMKTEFVSLSSHQLRTPITSINWITEMFLNGDFGELNKEQNESIKMINKSSRRMAELIDALLNISRLELGNFSINPEPLILRNIIDDTLKELSYAILKKEIIIKKNYQTKILKINTDQTLLRIILQNIISNAVFYTLPKTSVTIKTFIKKDYFIIKVIDQGIGIPKEDSSKIFTKLFRSSNAQSYKTDGNGLGLYITKLIIDSLNGTIHFDSTINKGTSFYIKIPIKSVPPKKSDKSLVVTKNNNLKI